VPRIVDPGVKVVCLDGFIARPGHAAAPGELVEVSSQRVADGLIAQGKARLPTPEDLARSADPIVRDPTPRNLDPSNRSKR
jgi:hypothetical protein